MTEANEEPGLLLYAEDEEADQYILSKIWKRVTGSRPHCVANGRELLDYLEACAAGQKPWPRLVLLDLNMPVMSGYEALDLIKADERFHRVPVVVLSTSSQREDVKACMERHANGYLVKASRPADLTEMLDAAHDFWFHKAVAP